MQVLIKAQWELLYADDLVIIVESLGELLNWIWKSGME